MLVYGIVENPENAIMTLFSYLAGAGVGREGFRNATNARRSMTGKEIDSLGSIKTDLNLIETVRSSVCGR
jgi:hypothetical protein